MTDRFELLQQGLQQRDFAKLREAEAHYEQALRATPDDANSWHLLAVIAQMLGNLEIAETRARRATGLVPNRAEFQNTLGLILAARGNRNAAIDQFLRAATLEPSYVPANENVARNLYETHRFVEARPFVDASARRNSSDPQALYRQAHTLTQLYELNAGMKLLRELTRVHPQMAEAWAEAGRVFAALGALPRGRKAYGRAMEAASENPNLRLAICRLEFESGFQRSAHDHYRSLIVEGSTDALIQFALRFPERITAAETAHLEAALPNVEARRALTLVADASADHHQAREHAQTLRKNAQTWQPSTWKDYLGRLMTAYTPATLKRARRSGRRTSGPVLVVGLPHSGADLLEQMIGAHPGLFRGGAARILPLAVHELNPRADRSSALLQAATAEASTLQAAAERSAARFAELSRTGARTTNHLPDLHLQLGWATMLFPEVQIIHAVRRSRDLALANWFSPAVGDLWSADPASALEYLRLYERLMRHWSQVLPNPPLTVVTDDLLADPEPTLNAVLNYCGVGASEECMQRAGALGRRYGNRMGPVCVDMHYEQLSDLAKEFDAIDAQLRDLTGPA